MAQPLTPPPSFRVLRVRPRTRTSSDENRCSHAPPGRASEALAKVARSRKDVSSSPTRGRTRTRVARNGLTLNTNYTRPHLSLALPSCCSPPSIRGEAPLPNSDDDLIFQMSPIQSHSPTSICFDTVRKGHADSSRVKPSTVQSLSALWEKHKASLTTSSTQAHLPRTPSRRTRTNTVTQHQRGFSDTHANVTPRRTGHNDLRPQQSAKTLLDFSSALHTPHTPMSPASAQPFLYSFPNFESSPLAKARRDRARRQADKAFMRDDFLSGGLELEAKGCSTDSSFDTDLGAAQSQRPGPIRARKLHIQSGGSVSDSLDDANFISRAFQSASLDPEKDSDTDADDDADDGYFSSQRSSSVSSLSTTEAASLIHDNAFSNSLLASLHLSSRSRTRSSSSSRPRSGHISSSELSPDTSADIMMTRGRASRRATNDGQFAVSGYVGGDRRGRGRTPAPVRRNSRDTQIATAAWTDSR